MAAGAFRWNSPPSVVRIISHAVAWTAVLVPVSRMMGMGWRALGDYAAIAAKAHQSLSLHPPTVGLYTTASGDVGRLLFDPGPLQFWLLAVPVRIDPAQGLLWGAGLLACAAFSLAIEAVWSTGSWVGCAVVAFVAVDLLWLTPTLFESIAWNAYFPIPFLVTAVAVAWTVGLGRLGWWPALVLAASIVAQCHLVFVLPAVLLVLVAPLIGVVVAGRPIRLRWLGVGLAVGVACWIAPVLQNLGAHGNLTALSHGESNVTTMGAGFGLRTLARAASPVPIWLTHEPLAVLERAAFVDTSSPVVGTLVLVALVAVAVGAWKAGHRPLAALSVLGLVNAASLVVDFTLLPSTSLLATMYYLVIWIWVTGILLWTVFAWALVEVGAALFRRSVGRLPTPAGARADPRVSWGIAGGAIATVVLVGTIGLIALPRFAPSQLTAQWDPALAHQVRIVATSIEGATRKGPVTFVIRTPQPVTEYTYELLSEGVAWQLDADGWQPGLTGYTASYTGLEVPPGDGWNWVNLELHGRSVTWVYIEHCSPSGSCIPATGR